MIHIAQILGNVLLQGRRKLKQIHVSVCTQIFETGMTQAGQTTALQSSTPTRISWMLKAVGWDFFFFFWFSWLKIAMHFPDTQLNPCTVSIRGWASIINQKTPIFLALCRCIFVCVCVCIIHIYIKKMLQQIFKASAWVLLKRHKSASKPID